MEATREATDSEIVLAAIRATLAEKFGPGGNIPVVCVEELVREMAGTSFAPDTVIGKAARRVVDHCEGTAGIADTWDAFVEEKTTEFRGVEYPAEVLCGGGTIVHATRVYRQMKGGGDAWRPPRARLLPTTARPGLPTRPTWASGGGIGSSSGGSRTARKPASLAPRMSWFG